MHKLLFLFLFNLNTPITAEKVSVLNFTADGENSFNSVKMHLPNQDPTEAITMCTWLKIFEDDVSVLRIPAPDGFLPYISVYFTVSLSQLTGYFNGHYFEVIDNSNIKKTEDWIYFCARFHNETSEIFINGVQLTVHYTDYLPEQVEPNINLANKIIKLSMTNDNGLSVMGLVYQYNFWKDLLSNSQLKDFGSCKLKSEGNLFPWSKLINGVKNGDDGGIEFDPILIASMEEGPCKKNVPGSNSDESGNSNPESTSGEMVQPGLNSGESGNSNPGSSLGKMEPGSSSAQDGNSDLGSSPGVSNPSQGGNSNPGSTSG